MTTSNTTNDVAARILDHRGLDQLAVTSVLLDQDQRCARCDRSGLMAGLNAHGWQLDDSDGNPVVAVLCGRCSAPRRAYAFMAEQASRQARGKLMDRSGQTLGLATMLTGSRPSRRDVEHEPTRGTSAEELQPGIDVRRPGIAVVTRLR